MSQLSIRTGSIFLMLLTLLISACGFHLRGDVKLDPAYSPLMIEPGNLTDAQQDTVRQALTRASAIVLDDAQQANRLELSASKLEARNVARSNITGITLVQLNMTLQYRLLDGRGKELVGSREVTERMEIERDDNNLLMHQAQLNNASQRLFRLLVSRMVSQLSHEA